MSNNKACADYLKDNPAYKRLMEELQKKWKRYGKAAGSVLLQSATREERRAIGGIVGRTYLEETVKITFQEFEQGLQKTRFAPIDMKGVLEAFFGSSLPTNREEKIQALEVRESFFNGLLRFFQGDSPKASSSFSWLQALVREKKYGYQIIMKEFLRDSREAENLVRNVGRALIRLEEMNGEECFLAVFAAAISGNPHYFDRGSTPSQLLTHALCFWKKINLPKRAYEWRECMQAAGIISDTIASMVHAFGVRLETEEGFHPAFEAFYHRKEPCVLTAENLKSVKGARASNKKVYVVENEMVFLYLFENVKELDVTLLCTSGQLRVAAFQLLDYLSKGGALLYYSGDIDAEGMDIADRLWRQYGDGIQLWRMGADDYKESISEETISKKQLAKLGSLKNRILARTAEAVAREKKAGYQENILNRLLEDVQKGV